MKEGAAMSEGKQEARAALNTDREIWREQRDQQAGGYSIHVTEGGGIGFNCGGHVIVMPFRKWFDLARQANQPQEARCIHCGRPMSKHPHVGVDPCPTARQANQPQGKAQPEQPGINLARWIWQRFSGIPITEPYDGEFRLLLLKIASYTDELKQRQSFADFHTESTAFQRGQPESGEMGRDEAIIRVRAQQEMRDMGFAHPADVTRMILSADASAFQRGQQAMAEKAAQAVRNLVLVFQLTKQDLAERKGAEKMREAILEQFRSLASAEPPQGEAEKEGRG